MRPSSLPHRRTCGFLHPAVETNGFHRPEFSSLSTHLTFNDDWSAAIPGWIAASILADIFFACVLISGSHALSPEPKPLRDALLLTIVIVLLRAVHYTMQVQVLDSLQLGLSLVFLIQMLVMIWLHIEKEYEVTKDLIMSAACIYILLGMAWAYAYYFLEFFHSASFKLTETSGDDLSDFFYYSFVTLTTVCYGDILAITKPARALTTLEAITGQLYLAIMISRLVGLYASQAGIGKGK